MENRNYAIDELDSTEEVVAEMQRLRNQIVDNEKNIKEDKSKIDELTSRIDDLISAPKPINRPKKSKPIRAKATRKKKGFTLMKTLVSIVVLLILVLAGNAIAAKITFEEASNIESLINWLNDNVNTDWYTFTPRTSAPSGSDATEGVVYYNDDTDTLYFTTDGSSWTAIASASGNSLDEAYNTGKKIEVDGTSIELEVDDNSTSGPALLIDYDDATNDGDAMQITNAADASTSVSLQIDGTAGYDIQGTSNTWNVSIAGAATFVGVTTSGELLVSASDVLFDDTYDVAWDTSRDTFIFQDNAVLGIGGAHDGAPDVGIKWNETNMLIEAATDNTGAIYLGSTNSMDFRIYASTNTSYATWDASAAEVIFDAYDLRMNDDDMIIFGDGATDSFTVDFDETTDNLILVATTANDAVQIGDGTTATDFKLMSTAADTSAFTWFDASGDTNNGQFKFGADDHGQDVIFYGATASQQVNWDQSADTWYFGADAEGVDVYLYGDTTVNYALWDESDDRLEMVAADIMLDDNSDFIIGSDSEWNIDNASEVLRVIPSDADDDFAIHLGSAANTTDLLVYGKTASELITWDASADSLTVVGDLSLFTMTGTTLPFHVNVTGTVAGEAAKLETTNGGITLLADGAANGDILIDAQDVITLVSTDADGVGIYLHANGGASEEINIHSDQGTGDESIYALSDVGGITLKAAAGSIDIEPTGNEAGDLGITVGDDMTVTVTGDYSLAVTGSTTLPDDVLRKTVVAVTAEQADNLRATPKELVAAEAGKMHEFVKVIVALDYGATAYTESDDNLAVRYENTTGVIVSDVIEATGLADATEDTVCFAGPAPTTSALVTEAASTNKALVLHNTGNGEWGNSGDSPLVVITYYRSHTTAELGL